MTTQQVSTLHLWTDGDPRVGIPGETAEVSAPGFLISSQIYDPETFQTRLDEFKQQIVAAFGLIWEDKVHALYDFELEAENRSHDPAVPAL